jgi:hypothetical protein
MLPEAAPATHIHWPSRSCQLPSKVRIGNKPVSPAPACLGHPMFLDLKDVDGDPHKRWIMRFNSMIHEEPYQGLTCQEVEVQVWCAAATLGVPCRCVEIEASCHVGARARVRCLQPQEAQKHVLGVTNGLCAVMLRWRAAELQKGRLLQSVLKACKSAMQGHHRTKRVPSR